RSLFTVLQLPKEASRFGDGGKDAPRKAQRVRECKLDAAMLQKLTGVGYVYTVDTSFCLVISLKGKMMVKKAYEVISFKELKRLNGNLPQIELLVDFYESRGMTQAKDETDANDLLSNGVSCFLIEGNGTTT
ncbi:MAG: hypothetical protein ACYC8S_03610, partial [Minisyncoccota bacterium]